SDTKVIHNDDGNPSRANIKQALGRSILTDSKIDMETFATLVTYEVLKLKNIKKDGYTRFQYQEQCEHVGPEVTRSQEGTMKGNCVYSLDGWAKSGETSVGIQENESLAQVWRKRLGHISEAGLHELERRDVLGNKGLGELEFCENCVLGKLTWVSFGRGQHTTEGVIDYVHADLWGPSRVESISG
ncbi:retrovirus-related pol polyprotein from transposon TNT 1-94, partial [Tanacetum coccineum]